MLAFNARLMVINRFLFSKKNQSSCSFSSQFLTFFSLSIYTFFADDLADHLETEPHSAPREEDVAQHLERLNVGAAAPSQGAGGKSCAGGIYSVPGSARTESRALNNAVSNARYKNPVLDDEELTDAEDDVQGREKAPTYAQTQVSGDNRRKKKVSVVKEPVYQNMKRKRNAKSPPALEKSAPPTKRGGLRSNRRAVKAEH